MTLKTPERLSRSAFGGADILKVQSQHERFLREIKNLPDEKKAEEVTNAVKFLKENKSDYWLETAHLLDILMGDKNKGGLYLLVNPNITKKEFCKKYLGISYGTVGDYLRVIRNYKKFGFADEQVRVLGFAKTRDVLRKTPQGTVSSYSRKSLKELIKLKQGQIYPKKKKSNLEMVKHYWNKSTNKEREEFLRFLNEKG